MTQRRKPRKYTDEFREEAVKLVTEQGYTVTEAAKSLGITTKLLYNWKDKLAKQASGEALSKDEKAELIKLRKENKRLLMEREILKKASVDSNGQCNSFTKILICIGRSNEATKTNIYTG